MTELIHETERVDYFVELQDTGKAYVHVKIKKFDKTAVRQAIEVFAFLSEKFNGLYCYAPCIQTIKLALATGFVPTDEDVIPYWGGDVKLPEFVFGE